ncbi:hypothetical protein B0H19DRAFT_1370840 [Mycena capillaripes]|nr:hypothetical protein B0H19DRAFT_1370840 [Mycena capillaripes]
MLSVSQHISPARTCLPGPYLKTPIVSHALRIRRLSCTPLLIQRLSCTCGNYPIPPKDLASLRDVIRKSSAIRELTLIFTKNLFYLHFDYKPYDSYHTQREVTHAFCSLLSAMTTNTPGPLFVLSGDTFFTGRAGEVAGWRLDFLTSESPRRTGLRASLARMLGQHDGETTRELRLTAIVHRWRTLHPNHFQHQHREQPSAVLPALKFPALISFTDGIDSTVLSEFLLWRAHLSKLEYRSFLEERDDTLSHPLFTSPPIGHPKLTEIHAHGANNIEHLMAGVHLSPLLNSFHFSYQPQAPDSSILAGLEPTFRLISQRADDVPVHLDLFISTGGGGANSDQSSSDADASDNARVLH